MFSFIFIGREYEMRILLNEIRKMLDFRIVAAVVFICLAGTYVISPFNDLVWIANACWQADAAEAYGANLSQEEREKLETELIPGYRKQIEEYITSHEDFAEVGIRNYEDFDYFYNVTRILSYNNYPDTKKIILEGDEHREFVEKYNITESDFRELTEAEENLVWEHLCARDGGYDELLNLVKKMEEVKSVAQEYDNPDKAANAAKSGFIAKRDEKILATDEINNISAEGSSVGDITTFITVMTAIAIGCVFLILLPSVTRDNLCNMQQLQLSTKCGRRLCFKRFLAMQTISFAVTTVFAAVTVYHLLKAVPAGLWQCKLNGFNNFMVFDLRFWFSGTLLQYTVIMGILAYLLVFASAAVICILSHTSKNYIQLILRSLPFAALFAASPLAFIRCAMCYSADDEAVNLSTLIEVPYIDVVLCVAFFALCIFLFARYNKRLKTRDIF